MGTQSDRHEDGLGPELLAQLRDGAEVLGVFDEGQDIALDLHERLFDPSTKQRTLAFLQSPQYEQAVNTYQRLTTGPVALQNPHTSDGAA
ncbi:hypothetical protein [Microbacterium maritypicum]|uniref:hypothetical protein n=1 Tax=Microbacterium maritypicum TaxID=33918 RepID=UPI0037F69EB4